MTVIAMTAIRIIVMMLIKFNFNFVSFVKYR